MCNRSERILLFIPMYNCERQIPRVISQLTPEISHLFHEVIIVDNRSPDGSRQAAIEALKLVHQIPAKLLENNENYGLGGSHKVAFDYALAHGFDYCIVLHGDDQGRISDLADLMADGSHRTVDCLLGARFMRGSQLAGYSTFRTLGNRAFNLFYSLVSGKRIYDLGAGLNMYSVKALADRRYRRHADDLTFNYHMILQSIADGWRIRFFPILWREDDQVSNVKLFRQASRVLGIALEYAFRRQQFLRRDHSRQPGRDYNASVLFENAAPPGAAA
jgi:glycosyltransferase involved in cell wall biosynthesis